LIVGILNLQSILPHLYFTALVNPV